MAPPAAEHFEPPRAFPPEGPPPQLSIVIPAYDEAARIGAYLDQIRAYFAGPEQRESCEVLVVDDGSRDGSAALVRARMAQDAALGLVSYSPNRGKGYAVRAGMHAARGALRLFADADGSTPTAELARLRAALPAGPHAVAVGSRDVRDPAVHIRVRFHRRFIGQVFRRLRYLVLRVNVLDSQCGFKLFTAEAAGTIFGAAQLDGFAFDVELLYLAARHGIPVAEVAVNWTDSPDSRVNLWRDPARMFADLWRIRRLHPGT